MNTVTTATVTNKIQEEEINQRTLTNGGVNNDKSQVTNQQELLNTGCQTLDCVDKHMNCPVENG